MLGLMAGRKTAGITDGLLDGLTFVSPLRVLRGRNIFHAGYIAAGRRPGSATAGELCSAAMQSGTGNYLANLVLYPGMGGRGHI